MDLTRIQNLAIASIRQSYTARDTILYALGLGYGSDPLDASELPFVYEEALRCVPSYVNLVCHPGFWSRQPEFGIDWVKILHAEQDFTMHASLPPAGTIRGEFSVAGVEDKGPGRGALMHQEKTLFDDATGQKIATVRSTLFLRGNGGEGGFGTAVQPALSLPDAQPSRVIEIPTLPRQALIYRLSGDWNPLHADPKIARAAGFAQPILHGLCTHGIACRAILAEYCDNEVARFGGMFVRFTSPVIPGETIRIEFHDTGPGQVRFRAIAKERGVTVLDRCSAVFAQA